ncbi:unnamed protein product [Brassica oleracea]|uniref:(rape) hypothetical protein n=1 Tax=Brassica napus TaxID=3708 RepID=A0A816UAS9_BRANA|nr:unnamed protein product [Brassica napus]
MHERLSGGSGENVASEHIGNSVSDLRVDQPEWLSDERTKTLTDLSGGYLRYMQVSAFDGGEDWSNYGREILTTSKEVVGSYLSFLFSINMSFSDSSGHGTPVTGEIISSFYSWIYENKEIQKLGRVYSYNITKEEIGTSFSFKCLTNAYMEALLLHILTLATGNIHQLLLIYLYWSMLLSIFFPRMPLKIIKL